MTKGAKIWLWIALVLCLLTTILNFSEGRIISVIIAIASLMGLILLLFKERKAGFYIMCICNAISCLYSIATSASLVEGTYFVVYVVMSIVGAMIVPLITFFMIRKSFVNLQ